MISAFRKCNHIWARDLCVMCTKPKLPALEIHFWIFEKIKIIYYVISYYILKLLLSFIVLYFSNWILSVFKKIKALLLKLIDILVTGKLISLLYENKADTSIIEVKKNPTVCRYRQR